MAMVGTPGQITAIVEGYGRLVRQHVGDAAQWQAVHRLSPRLAIPALAAVCQCADPRDLAVLLYTMSESPAMLFARLGDGTNYDERSRFVVFTSKRSADIFHRRYPDWFCWCDGDCEVGDG